MRVVAAKKAAAILFWFSGISALHGAAPYVIITFVPKIVRIYYVGDMEK
jgi:hypothetical protein